MSSDPPRPYHVIKGKKFPATFSSIAIQSAIDMELKAGDVALCTYPKCGTNWVKQIIELLRNNAKPLDDGLKMMYACPFVEQVGAETLERQKAPRFFTTHMDYDTIHKNPDAKYVYVVRNPKDCFLSLYHFLNKDIDGIQTERFNRMFDAFMTGEMGYGQFFDHVLGWYEHRNDPNVLFLYYEKIKKDHKGTVLQIARFLGTPYFDLVQDPKFLEDVLHYSGFEYMKANTGDLIDAMYNKYGYNCTEAEINASDLPKGLKYFMEGLKKNSVADNKGKIGLVRKGVVGDGKVTLTPEMNRRLDEEIKNRLKGTEMYEFWVAEGCF